MVIKLGLEKLIEKEEIDRACEKLSFFDDQSWSK